MMSYCVPSLCTVIFIVAIANNVISVRVLMGGAAL